jgi:predicted HAD superfamily Cof-like phosphohydrolase
MEKLDSLNQVAEFHNTFGAPVLPHPTIPHETRCSLRVKLLEEELEELKKAIADNDMVEIADALCDLQYVLSGAILEFGLGSKFVDLFNEVQRSNMSKACQSLEEAEQTVAHYLAKDGTEAEIKEENGVFKVYRISDNKVLKSIAYSPAQLKDILHK